MENTTLYENASLWPSPEAECMANGWLLVRDGLIDAMGAGEDDLPEAEHRVDVSGGLLMPGWIHTHLHLCQTLFRGAAEDLPLLPWLRTFIWPMEAAHTPETLRVSARLSIAELLRTGTVGFMSMETVRHTDVVVDEVMQSGLFGCVCHCLMDETAGVESLATPINEALDVCDQCCEQVRGSDRVEIGVAPRFVLSCSESNMKKAGEYARDRGLILHTHASEQMEEIELVQHRTGKRNIEYLHEIGLTGPDVGLAHCVHTDETERKILQETQTRVLHCPSANMKLGSGVAPIPEYLESGIHVSIGADGAPCNNRFDMFMELREAALMQSLRRGPGALSAEQAVLLGTQGGAEALGWDKQLGSLEPGKSASFMVIDREGVHALPGGRPATNIVYSHDPGDVKMTVVHGEVLYADGEWPRIDMEALKREALQARCTVESSAGLRSD